MNEAEYDAVQTLLSLGGVVVNKEVIKTMAATQQEQKVQRCQEVQKSFYRYQQHQMQMQMEMEQFYSQNIELIEEVEVETSAITTHMVQEDAEPHPPPTEENAIYDIQDILVTLAYQDEEGYLIVSQEEEVDIDENSSIHTVQEEVNAESHPQTAENEDIRHSSREGDEGCDQEAVMEEILIVGYQDDDLIVEEEVDIKETSSVPMVQEEEEITVMEVLEVELHPQEAEEDRRYENEGDDIPSSSSSREGDDLVPVMGKVSIDNMDMAYQGEEACERIVDHEEASSTPINNQTTDMIEEEEKEEETKMVKDLKVESHPSAEDEGDNQEVVKVLDKILIDVVAYQDDEKEGGLIVSGEAEVDIKETSSIHTDMVEEKEETNMMEVEPHSPPEDEEYENEDICNSSREDEVVEVNPDAIMEIISIDVALQTAANIVLVPLFGQIPSSSGSFELEYQDNGSVDDSGIHSSDLISAPNSEFTSLPPPPSPVSSSSSTSTCTSEEEDIFQSVLRSLREDSKIKHICAKGLTICKKDAGHGRFPCQRCYTEFYCSLQHQEENKGRHGPHCKIVAKLEAAAEEDYDHTIWLEYGAKQVYDLCLNFVLVWPSLTVQWFPYRITVGESNRTREKLLLGTQTTGVEMNHLLIAEVDTWGHHKFKGELRILQRINHDGEVHRARIMPGNPHIVATKGSKSDVFIFNLASFPELPEDANSFSPTLRLKGHRQEGFGLCWSPHVEDAGKIVSGSNDKLICVWDINAKGRGKAREIDGIPPLITLRSHTSVVEDVSWHPKTWHTLASGGDDRKLILWDIRKREPYRVVEDAHKADINSVAFSPNSEVCLVTGSSDKTISIWDMRRINSPLFTIDKSFTDKVLRVEWSPSNPYFIAGAGEDKRVLLFDVTTTPIRKISKVLPDWEFNHSGHVSTVSDIAWCPYEFGLASVAVDNILQVWKPSISMMNGESYEYSSSSSEEEEEDEDMDVDDMDN